MSHAPTRPAPAHKPFPHNFRRIRLELAREIGRPEGSARDGYILILPLDAEARIDVNSWREHRSLCRVVRFREDEEDERGRLQHQQDGGWSFHYSTPPDAEDEKALRLKTDHFTLGAYVAIREENGLHTYQVASVDYV